VDDHGGVFNGERLSVIRVLVVVVPPEPLHRLIKDDIAGDDDALVDGVITAVHLGPAFIADKDGLPTQIVEFLQVQSHVLDVCDTAEGVEVVHGRKLAVPCLICSLPVEGTRWRLIEDVNDR
jgi:hypothetical protein